VKKNSIFFLFYLFFLGFIPIIRVLIPLLPEILLPKFYIMILWGIPIYLSSKLNNPFSIMFSMFWIIWFLLGSINIVASYFVYGHWYLFDVEQTNLIYFFYIMTFIFGLLLIEKFIAKLNQHYKFDRKINSLKQDKILSDVNPAVGFFLIFFPFVWFLSIFLKIGYVPLLSGLNIEENMYSDDFGPLYGFTGINILSMLYVFDKIVNESSKIKIRLYSFLLLIYMFISVMNGKRMILIIFFSAALCFYIKSKGVKAFNLYFISVSFIIVILFYSSILFLRQGKGKSRNSTTASTFSIVGVEYRDFAWAINNIDAKDLVKHDWAASTFASGVNSSILSFFGINKYEETQKALGFVSKPLFMGGFFGVRTGLISELFFAYKYFGLAIIFLFGILVGWMNKLIVETKSKFILLFLSSTFSLFFLMILEQSIDVVGTIPVFFYFWIISIAILIPLHGRRK